MVNLCRDTPSLCSGSTVLSLSEKDFRDLELYQRKSLKQIQSFPDKTHSSAVLALLGILPLQRVIHKSMLNLFWRWFSCEGIEKDIAVRQLATKSDSESSWFNKVKQLLVLYDLPSSSQLLERVPSKFKWKRTLVEEQWREDIKSSPSLKYLSRGKCPLPMVLSTQQYTRQP